jgi:hypothetical protein
MSTKPLQRLQDKLNRLEKKILQIEKKYTTELKDLQAKIKTLEEYNNAMASEQFEHSKEFLRLNEVDIQEKSLGKSFLTNLSDNKGKFEGTIDDVQDVPTAPPMDVCAKQPSDISDSQ